MTRSRFLVMFVVLALMVTACATLPTTLPPGPLPTPSLNALTPGPLPTLTASALTPTLAPAESATATSAPTGIPAPTTRVLRIGAANYPELLDPQKVYDWPERQVLKLLYEGLVVLDAKGNPTPGAADRWEFSKQNKTLTFHVRDGLKRADGTALTANDFEYAFKRELDPRVPNRVYAYLLYNIKGAVEMDNLDPKKAKPEEIEKALANLGVKAINSSTLVVTFETPVSFWTAIASTWVTFPIDKRQVDRDPENWWNGPEGHNGNGAFKIQSMTRGIKIVLVPNENYWQGKPRLGRIELVYNSDPNALLELYRQNEIDIDANIATSLPSINSDAGLKSELYRYPAAITAGYAFNVTKRPFNDVNVRRAFSMAFDRERYIRDTAQNVGKPYTRWIPPGVPGAQADKSGTPAYDPKAAAALLANNGYGAKDSTADKPRVDCEKLGAIRLSYRASALNQTRFQFIAGNIISAISCPVTLEPVDPAAFDQLILDPKTTPQLSFQGWIQDYAHPHNWLAEYWACNAVAQRYGYCNKQLDALVEKADQDEDPAKALEAYQQAEELLLKDVPAIFTEYHENIFLIKPYVRGPKDNTSSADLLWPGEWGSIWTYDIDLTQVPKNYPQN